MAQFTVDCCESLNGIHEIIVRNKLDHSEEYKISLQKYHEVYLSKAVTIKALETIEKNITYRSSDVFVASYPKCGTTWGEQCVLLLLHGGDPTCLNPQYKNSYDSHHPELPGKIWIEAMLEQDPEMEQKMGNKEFASLTWPQLDEAANPRVFKTHFPVQEFLGVQREGVKNLPEGTKVLITCRNPLDACVSCYYHSLNKPHSPYLGMPFAAFAITWIEGYIVNGSYFDWIAGWYEEYLAYPDRIIWVQYEAMKEAPHAEVRRIAQALGCCISNEKKKEEKEEEFIDRVVKYSSFESMKAQTEERGGDVLGHLRRGENGDWRTHFTPELAQLVIEKTKERLPNAEAVLKYML